MYSCVCLQSSSKWKSFDKFLVIGARNIAMASGGRLLGLQLPPVSDFMPGCVRSTHNGDAKECSGSSSSAGLLALSARSNLEVLEDHSSFELSSFTEQDVEVEVVEGGNAKSEKKMESSPTPPICGWPVDTTEAGENSQLQSRGLRSKLSSMLSLEKRGMTGHSSQFMMEMSTRRAPMVDSKICMAAIQKESFTRMFDLYDERNLIAPVPGYGAASFGGYNVDRSADMGIKPDLSWIEEKSNDAWGTEPWHSDQRNILMKTLHIMRCDIESLKVT